MKKGQEIKTLDLEIIQIKLQRLGKCVDTINQILKKRRHSLLKNLIVLLSIITLYAVGSIVFHSIALGGVASMIYAAFMFVKQKKESKKESTSEQMEEFDQVIEDNQENDFFSEDYKQLLQAKIPENQTKYQEALEKQQEQRRKIIKLQEYDLRFLDEEGAKERLKKEIDVYTFAYDLPPLHISEEEWDIYFDTVYQLFQEKQMDLYFYDKTSEIIRITLASALVYKATEITIQDFSENLSLLNTPSEEKEQESKIKKKDIKQAQKEIEDKMKKKKIIDISAYIKK